MRADLEWVSIPGLVQSSAERFADLEALVDGDLRLSFGQLAASVLEATQAAIALGLDPGDRAAIWAPNIAEWVIAALGVLSAGGVLVPLNTRFKGSEAAFVLAKSGARLLFTVTDFLGTDYVSMLGPERAALPALERVVVLKGPAAAGTISWSEALAAGAAVPAADARRRIAAVRSEDISDIIFTSGTTGRPKGVMVTHGQSLRVYEAWTDIVGLTSGDRYLVVNPFFHTFGYKAGFVSAIMRGATTIPQAVFDVPAVLARVAEERISMLPGAPTLYQSILNHPERDAYDLSSLRLAVTGAAVVPVELIKRMRSELTFKTIITAYGLTESTGTAAACRHDDDPETIANTSGRAIPDTELRVADDAGRELARGEPGELLVRGYNVMLGYYDDPEATASAIDADGWLHTGDVAVMDDRGYIRITDRKKDMFIVGGFNAYPAEIEGMMLRHPSIAQVAVVGVPDERMGEVGMAFVVPRPGEQIDPEALITWCREQMANYKAPREVRVVDALPLNASGKVLKYELRELAGQSPPP
ncbi:MAG TPA: FadD3 family acyl-CoA ligase [Acidimicrobiales bacterium]|nr:FadD3 family acyl-CoA ligase [Acidimicrobiales bacterium]